MGAIHDGVFIDPARAGSVGTDDGMHICREPPCDLLEIFRYPGTRPVEIGAVLKYNKDVGVAKHCLSAHASDARSGKQGSDNGVRHLIFNDAWRLSGPRRVDDDLHVADIWQRIEGHT